MREALIDANRVSGQSNITACLKFLASAPCCCLQAIAGSVNTLRRGEIEVCEGHLRGAAPDLLFGCGYGVVHAPIK
jgi:hypothetical protein